MRNSFLRKYTPAIVALVLSSTVGPRLGAADTDDLKALRDEIRALEQKILVLERKQEIKDEDAAAAAKTAPKVSITDKGFTLSSADNANSFKLRGLVQFDSRIFLDDNGILNNTFLLRRARLIAEGTFAKNYTFQIVPEFGGGSGTAASAFTVLDANLGVTINKELQFKFGKFKEPVGLELLASDSWTFFNERSLVTNLVPNRDVGIQASGDLFNGTVNYSAGIFNGVADAASSTNADFDNDKDVAGRLFVSPFRNDASSPVQGLSFGVAGTFGRQKGASGRTAGYKTDGQQTFFSYAANTIADGESWRVSPQFDYRNGSFGAIGEYVLSTVNVRPSATGAKAELQNKAWQLSAGYVLTGEDSSATGVVPKQNFDFANGTWGAFEVAARFADLKIDDKAFPLFASVATNADEASTFGLGLNWYLSKAVRVTFDYYQTNFDFAPGAPLISTAPVLRQDEKGFISRFQVSF
jgi:phosphate-selective porin OprO/OprP